MNIAQTSIQCVKLQHFFQNCIITVDALNNLQKYHSHQKREM